MFLYYTFTAFKDKATFTGVSTNPVPCLTNPVPSQCRIGYLNDSVTNHTIVGGSFTVLNVGLNTTDTGLSAPHAIIRLYYN
jgi:hypothetical protein